MGSGCRKTRQWAEQASLSWTVISGFGAALIVCGPVRSESCGGSGGQHEPKRTEYRVWVALLGSRCSRLTIHGTYTYLYIPLQGLVCICVFLQLHNGHRNEASPQ